MRSSAAAAGAGTVGPGKHPLGSQAQLASLLVIAAIVYAEQEQSAQRDSKVFEAAAVTAAVRWESVGYVGASVCAVTAAVTAAMTAAVTAAMTAAVTAVATAAVTAVVIEGTQRHTALSSIQHTSSHHCPALPAARLDPPRRPAPPYLARSDLQRGFEAHKLGAQTSLEQRAGCSLGPSHSSIASRAAAAANGCCASSIALSTASLASCASAS